MKDKNSLPNIDFHTAPDNAYHAATKEPAVNDVDNKPESEEQLLKRILGDQYKPLDFNHDLVHIETQESDDNASSQSLSTDTPSDKPEELNAYSRHIADNTGIELVEEVLDHDPLSVQPADNHPALEATNNSTDQDAFDSTDESSKAEQEITQTAFSRTLSEEDKLLRSILGDDYQPSVPMTSHLSSTIDNQPLQPPLQTEKIDELLQRILGDDYYKHQKGIAEIDKPLLASLTNEAIETDAIDVEKLCEKLNSMWSVISIDPEIKEKLETLWRILNTNDTELSSISDSLHLFNKPPYTLAADEDKNINLAQDDIFREVYDHQPFTENTATDDRYEETTAVDNILKNSGLDNLASEPVSEPVLPAADNTETSRYNASHSIEIESSETPLEQNNNEYTTTTETLTSDDISDLLSPAQDKAEAELLKALAADTEIELHDLMADKLFKKITSTESLEKESDNLPTPELEDTLNVFTETGHLTEATSQQTEVIASTLFKPISDSVLKEATLAGSQTKTAGNILEPAFENTNYTLPSNKYIPDQVLNQQDNYVSKTTIKEVAKRPVSNASETPNHYAKDFKSSSSLAAANHKPRNKNFEIKPDYRTIIKNNGSHIHAKKERSGSYIFLSGTVFIALMVTVLFMIFSTKNQSKQLASSIDINPVIKESVIQSVDYLAESKSQNTAAIEPGHEHSISDQRTTPDIAEADTELSVSDNTPTSTNGINEKPTAKVITGALLADDLSATADTENNKAEKITIEEPLDQAFQQEIISQVKQMKKGEVFTSKGNTYSWSLNLDSVYKTKKPTKAMIDSLHSKDIPAEVMLVMINKKSWYRICITGFSSREDAIDYMSVVRQRTDINKYWISKSRNTSK
ncbi:MAG: SPOR domain-containing protein [Gammaproteobacteria bacterium]|nr:SPOR domain-containing protein [Gammaproteobacteria bacterium]